MKEGGFSMTNYSNCPNCGIKLSSHKGHTKTFNQLTSIEQRRSIQAMTINLKRAIRKHSNNVNYPENILKSIRILLRR